MESVPTVPSESDGLDRWRNRPLRQLVHVYPSLVAMVKHDSGGRMMYGHAICIEHHHQFWDYQNRLLTREVFGLIHEFPPRRAIHSSNSSV